MIDNICIITFESKRRHFSTYIPYGHHNLGFRPGASRKYMYIRAFLLPRCDAVILRTFLSYVYLSIGYELRLALPTSGCYSCARTRLGFRTKHPSMGVCTLFYGLVPFRDWRSRHGSTPGEVSIHSYW